MNKLSLKKPHYLLIGGDPKFYIKDFSNFKNEAIDGFIGPEC